jgi:cation:H+ antiporter
VSVLAPVLVLIVAGAAVWWAGHHLSRLADQLAIATGVGRVLVGALLLGGVTSLPEVATTVTAGVLGNPQLAIGNLLGGVALQVVVIAVADVFESRQQLTFQVSEPSVLVQHVVLLLLLALVVAAIAVGEPVVVAEVGLWPVGIAAAYLAGLAAVRRADQRGGWEVADDGPRLGLGAGTGAGEQEAGETEAPAWWKLVALGGVVLVAGWLTAQAGDEIAQAGVLSGTFVGAVLVALTTSLPELSTVIGSLRQGSYDMAVSNIMGTNGLEVALLLVADIAYRDGPLLAHATSSDLFLTALGAVLTTLYLGGLLLRRERTVLRVGHDSAAVVAVYAAGIAVLAVL